MSGAPRLRCLRREAARDRPGRPARQVDLFEQAGMPAKASGYAGLALPAELLIGLGHGLSVRPLFATATREADPADAGATGAAANIAQQVGASVGTAVLNTIAATASYAAGQHGLAARSGRQPRLQRRQRLGRRRAGAGRARRRDAHHHPARPRPVTEGSQGSCLRGGRVVRGRRRARPLVAAVDGQSR